MLSEVNEIYTNMQKCELSETVSNFKAKCEFLHIVNATLLPMSLTVIQRQLLVTDVGRY